jgi:hypothetical protein
MKDDTEAAGLDVNAQSVITQKKGLLLLIVTARLGTQHTEQAKITASFLIITTCRKTSKDIQHHAILGKTKPFAVGHTIPLQRCRSRYTETILVGGATPTRRRTTTRRRRSDCLENHGNFRQADVVARIGGKDWT